MDSEESQALAGDNGRVYRYANQPEGKGTFSNDLESVTPWNSMYSV